MISKYKLSTVIVFRNVSYSQFSCKLMMNFCFWKECKFFHVSAVDYKKSHPATRKRPELQVNKYKPVKVWKHMSVKEIAQAMDIKIADLNSFMPEMKLKPDLKIESPQLFSSVAHKLGQKLELIKNPNKKKQSDKKEFFLRQPPSKPENLIKRPPVVTVMGHVDHGKTTLLDSLRNSSIVLHEFGGITQHIGAFSVEVKPGERITFIDTPGHAAFVTMRSRGAEVTDIVVLVVAADDGVMEQTLESIKIATAAEVRIIVAVNKIDKPSSLPIEEIKRRLLVEGIQVEDLGGDIQLVPISALKKINLDLLIETILLEAELMNLKGDPTGLVEGFVIESKMEKIGIVATIIVKRGTLTKTKIIVAGKAHARVRKMVDENGVEFDKALPSTPVQIHGWKELPSAGDEVFEVASEKQANAILREKERQEMLQKAEAQKEVIQKKAFEHQKKWCELRNIMNSFESGKERRKFFFESKIQEHKKESESKDSTPHLKLILKGDVYGTIEVLLQILGSYDKNDECKMSIIDSSVGDVKAKDVEMAEFFNAIIYAFNVKLHPEANEFLKEKSVDIRYHNVLYKLVDDLKIELNSRILPKDEEQINGEAEVLENFMITHASKKVPVAGARCLKGELKKESLYRVLRNNEVIYEGKLLVMKHEKKVVKSIAKGMECGLMIEGFPDKFKAKDKIICYDMIKVPKTTSWDPGF